jgi:hypothetical protein
MRTHRPYLPRYAITITHLRTLSFHETGTTRGGPRVLTTSAECCDWKNISPSPRSGPFSLQTTGAASPSSAHSSQHDHGKYRFTNHRSISLGAKVQTWSVSITSTALVAETWSSKGGRVIIYTPSYEEMYTRVRQEITWLPQTTKRIQFEEIPIPIPRLFSHRLSSVPSAPTSLRNIIP